MVELQPSKLIAWVRFPSPAPPLYIMDGLEVWAWNMGWKRVVAKSGSAAHIAQSVEHFLGKEEVIGSIPIMGSINFHYCSSMVEKLQVMFSGR